jgi:hypothetical protein
MARKANPVNWFEIPAVNIDRAMAFYKTVFGFKLTKEPMGPSTLAFFPMVDGQYGSAGALMKAKGYKPSRSGIVVYFPVSSINAALARINAKGGKTIVPKTDIGKYGFFAHFADTEGNRLGLHSMK